MAISLNVNGLEWGEMVWYWDYVGTLIEFPYTKSVNGLNEIENIFPHALSGDFFHTWNIKQSRKT